MNAAQRLHALGQSLWLDNITRTMLGDGTLARYIRDFAVTGLTSNPTIFLEAIRNGFCYDKAIRGKSTHGKSGEGLFFELALEDLVRAADLFRPIHDATQGIDGWVSLEVSPLLADDAAATVKAAIDLHARAQRPNLYIKIPGTAAGCVAIEDAIFAGVPVNVTLLFSPDQYRAAAEAWLCGIERRLDAGLDPKIGSVASVFISRWDTAVRDQVPAELNNTLGLAIGQQCYAAYRALLSSPRWQQVIQAGAQPQRLLWASTGTKDSALRDTFYVEALASADTVNTIPEKTLTAFADHGDETASRLSLDSPGFAAFERAGVDIAAIARRLQLDGAQAFVRAWQELLGCIADKACD
ncbi:MAG: transaldolase [Nevskia sp.]